jgi:hypothetical protein
MAGFGTIVGAPATDVTLAARIAGPVTEPLVIGPVTSTVNDAFPEASVVALMEPGRAAAVPPLTFAWVMPAEPVVENTTAALAIGAFPDVLSRIVASTVNVVVPRGTKAAVGLLGVTPVPVILIELFATETTWLLTVMLAVADLAPDGTVVDGVTAPAGFTKPVMAIVPAVDPDEIAGGAVGNVSLIEPPATTGVRGFTVGEPGIV